MTRATVTSLQDGAAAEYVPGSHDLERLAAASDACRGCGLWERATQAVFGEGRAGASLMLVGEQPGDSEDREGRPFVGPAGRLLDRVLEDAQIPRDEAYVTNVVKHFKWEPRGKRRIHQKPNEREIDACGPWLAAEIEIVRPQVMVLLGASAAQALLGRDFRVSRMRGEILEDTGLAPHVMATVHPSSVLRAADEAQRRAGIEQLTEEFRRIAPLVNGHQG